ncbi:ATP-binding protein [Mucilaginibacter sp. X5P1]|uniref:ATP-binding protein n=1 Tax=Mucilaginibacter sp. X5P1 TaxID=2723088 RepID=UPI00160E972D|nr:ATP-binding protein [Mucilaginibacter sp. X5P1]MBB6138363.1 signal transduction histidine kinase/ActR/RegA family two-component response regulator [Mucilaginibacter sp. X5P1]
MQTMDYHHLLNKQVKKLLPESYLEDDTIVQFLNAINSSFNNFDRAKNLADHAFNISEQEYQQVTANLREQNEIKQRSISQIKEAIKSLDPKAEFKMDDSDDDLIHIISFLKQRIEEAKLLELELINAKDVAEKAAMAKTQFLSVMSHEIRTPMNAVIGFTHLLIHQDPKPEQVEFLNFLKFSAENLLVLINDILDFNKIEAGKIEFESVDFSIKDLISNTRLSLLQKANEKDIKIKLMLDQDLPNALIGDPVRLGQILTNLISNAVKFTNSGKVTITASLAQHDNDHSTIDFEVADTGIGIMPDKLDYIFDSFSQASSDTTRKFGGSGLGLTITKRLLQLQGSDIYVKSEYGKGSEFTFSLTFKNSSKRINNILNSDEFYSLKSLKGTKLLIAEDNLINVILAKEFMKQWDVDCDVAENGEIALMLVKTNNYDMVLMDLQMPEMDGYQTTIAIRELEGEKYKKLPILALTASAMLDIQDQAFTVGMNDYISKPFNPNELHRKIAAYSNKN